MFPPITQFSFPFNAHWRTLSPMAKPAGRNSRNNARDRRRPIVAVALGVAVIASVLAIFLNVHRYEPLASVGTRADNRSNDKPDFSGYGGSASCRECHEEAFAMWSTSHHGLAERPIQSAIDRNAFDPVRSFPHGTQTSDLRWTNDAATVTSIGLSGKPETHAIVRVIGEDPLRQYLVSFPGGRFQALEAAYDPRSNQWFNVYGNEDRRPGEWGHWTGRGMNWNFMCASCHNTRLRRNYDEATDTYHTTMAESTVGCEACHGPLKAHNDWQKQFGKSGRKDPTLTTFSREQTLDYCGACHARRTELTGDFKPGDRFADHFELTIVDRTERYYADGQVREEDYEYASFLGSRMHSRGVYCLDCHNPHSAKTFLPGNFLCLRCHNGSYTNAPVINPATHSHHKVHGFDTNGAMAGIVDLTKYQPNSIKETGGECVNCHMPQTVYMQRHWRHDHGFTIPDPLLTKQFGIPNACNRCHQDKDADWSIRYCAEWYGAKMERPTRQRAQLIARAQQGETAVREELLAFLRQEESPYWRAVELGLLEPWAARPDVIAALRRGLEDTNALVRLTAAHALEPAVSSLAPGVVDALHRPLNDPVRGVRLAAEWSLRSTLGPVSGPANELRLYLDQNADEPAGQLQKGSYFLSRNDPTNALPHLQKAVAWDPYSPPLHQQLASAFSALNRPQDAVDTLKEACRLAPRDAESHYQLGLALNELGDRNGVIDQLTRAVELDPRHARAWYNLGLARNAAGQTDAALQSLSRAEALDPEDARIPYARATILLSGGWTREALAAVKRSLAINPSYTEAQQLLQALSR
jgi:tetratricopeptide (TPR) repeat protein